MPAQAVPYSRELDAAIAAARAGGAIVKDYYDRSAALTYQKDDGSPVTDADIAADRIIRKVLQERFPEDAILTEEGQDDRRRLGQARCWIVDPIDGTEQFIQRTGEFDVLVALVENGRPVAAAGLRPTTCTLVTATKGGGAWMQVGDAQPRPISFEPVVETLRIATSKWFGAPDNETIMTGIAHRLGLSAGSTIVTGFAPAMFLSPRDFDVMIGVRAGGDQTMASEWDFAVSDLMVTEVGGTVTDLEGAHYQYNKPRPLVGGGLIAAVDPRTHAMVLDAVRRERFTDTLESGT